jgi:hypothetical protein
MVPGLRSLIPIIPALLLTCGLPLSGEKVGATEEKIIVRIKDKDGNEKTIEVLEGGSIRLERSDGSVLASIPVVKPSTPKTSTDRTAPIPLKLKEVVSGRLGNSEQTGKFHFWLVDLPAGNYKVVLDVRRADDAHSNVGGMLLRMSPEGEKLGRLGSMITVGHRFRSIFRLKLEKPWKGIVRYENLYTISDYSLGIFPASDTVTGLFFSDPPKILPLELGKPVTTPELDGRSAPKRDAYYGIRLPAGDYKIVADFRRSDKKKSNVGGEVRVFDSDGAFVKRPLNVIDVDFSSLGTAKFSLAEEQSVFFMVRAYDARETVRFSVSPWAEK